MRSDEAAEAIACGWSVDEAVRRHPTVVQRIERQELDRQIADARWARSQAEIRRLGEAMRAQDDAEHAQRQRRRSVVDALDIHVDANGSAVRFWIAASDPTYWAIEVDKGERNELGERDSLEQCLALVAERVSQIGDPNARIRAWAQAGVETQPAGSSDKRPNPRGPREAVGTKLENPSTLF